MIWIVGGTSESVELINSLKVSLGDLFMRKKILVTSATESYKEFVDAKIISSRLNKEEMIDFIRKNEVNLIVDTSHPYAKDLSSNINEVSKELGVRLIAFERGLEEIPDFAKRVPSYEDAIEYLRDFKGIALFTTGTKFSKEFMANKNKEARYIFRILPDLESLRQLKELSIPMRDIIAMVGPFSKKMNEVQIIESGASLLVTKEAGKRGGFKEKIEACESTKTRVLVIERPKIYDENRFKTIEELKNEIVSFIGT